MPSTVIQSYEYVAEKEWLIITFLSGKRYQYMKVSAESYNDFKSAFSKGTHFNRFIKPFHAFKQLKSKKDHQV